jgi:hypothetical protein
VELNAGGYLFTQGDSTTGIGFGGTKFASAANKGTLQAGAGGAILKGTGVITGTLASIANATSEGGLTVSAVSTLDIQGSLSVHGAGGDPANYYTLNNVKIRAGTSDMAMLTTAANFDASTGNMFTLTPTAELTIAENGSIAIAGAGVVKGPNTQYSVGTYKATGGAVKLNFKAQGAGDEIQPVETASNFVVSGAGGISITLGTTDASDATYRFISHGVGGPRLVEFGVGTDSLGDYNIMLRGLDGPTEAVIPRKARIENGSRLHAINDTAILNAQYGSLGSITLMGGIASRSFYSTDNWSTDLARTIVSIEAWDQAAIETPISFYPGSVWNSLGDITFTNFKSTAVFWNYTAP